MTENCLITSVSTCNTSFNSKTSMFLISKSNLILMKKYIFSMENVYYHRVNIVENGIY